jgi:hypothetical protein
MHNVTQPIEISGVDVFRVSTKFLADGTVRSAYTILDPETGDDRNNDELLVIDNPTEASIAAAVNEILAR